MRNECQWPPRLPRSFDLGLLVLAAFARPRAPEGTPVAAVPPVAGRVGAITGTALERTAPLRALDVATVARPVPLAEAPAVTGPRLVLVLGARPALPITRGRRLGTAETTSLLASEPRSRLATLLRVAA
jgi:hypothetical protein